MRVELINWRTKGTKPLGSHLVQVLRNSRSFRKVDSTKIASFENKANAGSDPVMGIQIIREAYPGNMTLGGQLEERPTRHVAHIVNNSIAISSGFVIPVFPHFERKITFRVRRAGRHIKSYSYYSNYRVVLGWVALLLLPWSESDYIKKDLTRLAQQFMADANRDAVFANCERRAHVE